MEHEDGTFGRCWTTIFPLQSSGFQAPCGSLPGRIAGADGCTGIFARTIGAHHGGQTGMDGPRSI